MTRYLIGILLLWQCSQAFAQQYDKVWMFGSPAGTLTFDTDSIVSAQLPDTILSFLTEGSMCDKEGHFLFFTNGVNVYNRQWHIMPNGDSLSYPSQYYDQVVQNGMPSLQGVVILPMPDDSQRYYIFHYTPTDSIDRVAGGVPLNLYYSIVDMSLDSGRGAITAKNITLIQNEFLSWSRMAACKHANGRDWWIVKNAWYENIYYTFLLSPGGVQGPFVQQIGPKYAHVNDQNAYSQFSPDGSKYISFTIGSQIVLLDFDRCTGLFSNPDSFFNSTPGQINVSGAVSGAYSPSGRYFYLNNRLQLNQYDMSRHPIGDSVRIVTLTDSSDFYQMDVVQSAPNGKIYISCWNGGRAQIHVINQPDSFGLACDFHLYGQPVPTINPSSLPYFPNYRLGPLAGSACDTLTALAETQRGNKNLQISPNPASNVLYLDFDPQGFDLGLTDMAGRSYTLHRMQRAIDISYLASGVYCLHIQNKEGATVRRFVKE